MPIEFDGPNSKVSANVIEAQSGSTITIQSGHNLSGGGSGLTALNATQLTSGTIPIARIADDAITLAKMAGGTDGQVITYDASGNPVAVGPGTDGQVLTSTGAGSPPAFEDAAGGVDGITSSANATAISIDANEIVTMPKQPCFLARLSANQNNCTGNATAPTVALNTEVFDLNSDFNTSTHTFTAPVTGKYLLMGSVRVSGVTGACEAWKIMIDTSNQQWQTFNHDSGVWDMGGSTLHYHMQIIADMDAGDTADLKVAIHGESGTPCDLDGGHDNRFCGVLVA